MPLCKARTWMFPRTAPFSKVHFKATWSHSTNLVRSDLGYRCLQETGDDLSRALPLYSRRRAPEAKHIVELSRGFDRTGIPGFFGFILPLIVDSICHKFAPAVFAPNTISFLQQDSYTFRQIRLRKTLDRIYQGALFAALVGIVSMGARSAWAGFGVPLMSLLFGVTM